MKPEPLRGKIEEIEIKSPAWSGGDVPIFLIFTKSSVKSAVEFYKKYRYSPSKLNRDKKDLVPEEFLEFNYRSYKYNEWLVNYCFGDVIE